jgi:hypothetical protein
MHRAYVHCQHCARITKADHRSEAQLLALLLAPLDQRFRIKLIVPGSDRRTARGKGVKHESDNSRTGAGALESSWERDIWVDAAAGIHAPPIAFSQRRRLYTRHRQRSHERKWNSFVTNQHASQLLRPPLAQGREMQTSFFTLTFDQAEACAWRKASGDLRI